MASEQDKVADGINKPMLGVSLVVIVVGFILTITIALMPLGLVIMAIGIIWLIALLVSAKVRANVDFPK